MKFNFKNKNSIIYFFILMLSIFSFFYLLIKLPVRINLTSSVKKGVYFINSTENIKKGDYIALCLNEKYSERIYKKGYINKGYDCHGRYESLLKKIIAIPNDEIEVNKNFILINGQKIRLKTQAVDRNNQPIPQIKYANKFKLKGYWVIGDNHPNSFDSRYFGQISKKQILYKARPWLLF
tara:strand:- start:121 stop:660 length:540 start_codon:yes stop_codon:yes gene_type:complete